MKRDLKSPKPLIAKRGRPAAITKATKAKIKRLLHGRMNMSTRLAEKKLKEKGINISRQSVWRVAKSEGLSKKKNRRTFRLTRDQMKKRVQYAKMQQGKPLDDLVFLDESVVERTSPPQTQKTTGRGC